MCILWWYPEGGKKTTEEESGVLEDEKGGEGVVEHVEHASGGEKAEEKE